LGAVKVPFRHQRAGELFRGNMQNSPKGLRDHLKNPGRERLRGALEFPRNIEKKIKSWEDYLGRRD